MTSVSLPTSCNNLRDTLAWKIIVPSLIMAKKFAPIITNVAPAELHQPLPHERAEVSDGNIVLSERSEM